MDCFQSHLFCKRSRFMFSHKFSRIVSLLALVAIFCANVFSCSKDPTAGTTAVSHSPNPQPRIGGWAFQGQLPMKVDINSAYLQIVPMRVLKVDRVIGVADVELPNGNTLFMDNPYVVALEAGTYFRFLPNHTPQSVLVHLTLPNWQDRDQMVEVLELADIDFSKTNYYDDAVGP